MKTITYYGSKEITYEENFWTGKKVISINGQPLTKVTKNNYTLGGTGYALKGNFLTGVTLTGGEERYTLVRPLNPLEYLLCFFPFLLVLIGGAIGGGLGAVAGMSNAIIVRKIHNIPLKILASLATAAAAYALWLLASTLLLSALS